MATTHRALRTHFPLPPRKSVRQFSHLPEEPPILWKTLAPMAPDAFFSILTEAQLHEVISDRPEDARFKNLISRRLMAWRQQFQLFQSSSARPQRLRMQARLPLYFG